MVNFIFNYAPHRIINLVIHDQTIFYLETTLVFYEKIEFCYYCEYIINCATNKMNNTEEIDTENLKFLMAINEPISKHFDLFNDKEDTFNFFEQFPYMHLSFNDESLKPSDINFVYMIYKDVIENFSLY